VNELNFAISRVMPYVSGAVTLVAAGLVIWRSRETGQSWLRLMAWGLSLSVVGWLVARIWGIVYPIIQSRLWDQLRLDDFARTQAINSGVQYFRQILGAVGIVFVLISAAQAARQARPPNINSESDNAKP
jgi:hypothetical protein